MGDIFQNAQLKVKRAHSHIDTLIGETSPLSPKLYEFSVRRVRSVPFLAEPDKFDLGYWPKEPISEYFGAIIGDAVNNLREALDYWINAAVAAIGPAKKLHFPFSAERKDLEASKHYLSVEKAFPDLANFISKKIEPCRDTNLHLWAASSLCNDNKHNDFVPVATVGIIQNVTAGPLENPGFMNRCGRRGDANGPLPLMRSDRPITVQNDFKTTVEIKFPKGAIFEDQPVIPTLLNMSQVVSETLGALTAFVRPFIK